MLRFCLRLILVASLAISGWQIYQITTNPAVSALVDRTKIEITSRMNKEMISAVTPQKLSEKLAERLKEDPVNWLSITEIQEVAEIRKIEIPQSLKEELDAKYDEDHGFLKTSGKCLSCGWDAGNCELSAVLLCRAPVDLTPIGDVSGVVRESANYALGRPVDQLDLTLSTIGLGASALAAPTAGTSLPLKLGASVLKSMHKIGKLSPGIKNMTQEAAQTAIQWDRLAEGSFKNIDEVISLNALEPLSNVAKAAGDIRANTSLLHTVHLMKYVNSADEAAATAKIADALGPRTLSTFEILGKSRTLRAALKYSDEALAAIVAIISALLSCLGLLATTLLNRTTRLALRHTRS